ncbi:hypothetical protein ES703_80505 [subsurface metagenome]
MVILVPLKLKPGEALPCPMFPAAVMRFRDSKISLSRSLLMLNRELEILTSLNEWMGSLVKMRSKML